MPHELTSHKVNGLNEQIHIAVLDEPGQGGACHHYRMSLSCKSPEGKVSELRIDVMFQNGPVKEFGENGFTNESLLAIVEHRLVCFQAGAFACRENAIALTKLQECMMWLQKRTRDRLARGVEGTNVK